jgi:short subunit dehydrogenase-like uncharacterized protein
VTAEHDLVLFGATGFTGGLVADYLAEHAELPEPANWALAGRDRSRLEAVRARLAARNPALAELDLLIADAGDPASLRRIAQSARVIISTVGPYIHYGEGLVAACAQAGTDYVDLTGEPEFVDLMYLRHHAEAQRTGARLVHSCGFDSVPHDLGTLFTVEHLPEGVPLRVAEYLRSGGTMSGGTYHTLVHGLSRARNGLRVGRERRRAEPPLAGGRRVRAIRGRPRHDEIAGGWVLAAPTIDVDTVLRSARALPRYGPDFGYGLSIVARRAATLGALAAGIGTLGVLAQVPPARDLLLKLKDPGSGPDAERRARSWFNARFAGYAGDAATPSVVCEVAGGDPGYGETAKMLAESALCLAHDALPVTAGQVTPAVAMGAALIERLQRAGIRFSVQGDGGA